MQAQRDTLVAAGLEPPRPSRGALAKQWGALEAWANEIRPDYEKSAAELDDLARAKAAERDAAYGELAAPRRLPRRRTRPANRRSRR